MIRFLPMVFLVIASACLSAQPDSILLTKNFKFVDGVYVSFEDFQQNQPTYLWDDLSANLATSEEGFIAQVEYIKHKKNSLDLQQVWGICLGGIPYVRLPEGEVTKTATVFAGLRVRGKICYFKYKDEEIDMVEVKAYNPVNGRPFRQAKVPVERVVERERILDWQSGEIVHFNRENLLAWIADDRQLWNTLRDLPSEEVSEKLFRVLLIYVDRNNVYLK